MVNGVQNCLDNSYNDYKASLDADAQPQKLVKNSQEETTFTTEVLKVCQTASNYLFTTAAIAASGMVAIVLYKKKYPESKEIATPIVGTWDPLTFATTTALATLSVGIAIQTVGKIIDKITTDQKQQKVIHANAQASLDNKNRIERIRRISDADIDGGADYYLTGPKISPRNKLPQPPVFKN